MCDRISVRVLRECVLCCVVEDENEEDCVCYDGFICDIFSNG